MRSRSYSAELSASGSLDDAKTQQNEPGGDEEQPFGKGIDHDARNAEYDPGSIDRVRDFGDVPIDLPHSATAISLRKCANQIAFAEYCQVPMDGTGKSDAVEHVIVVSTTDQVLTFWSVSNFRNLGLVDTTSVHRELVWSTVGEALFTRTDSGNAVQVWDARLRRKVHSLEDPTDHATALCRINSLSIVCAGSMDTNIYVYKVPALAWMKSAKPRLLATLDAHVRGIQALSADERSGRMVSLGTSPSELFVWDMRLLRLVTKVRGHTEEIVGFGLMSADPFHLMTCDSVGILRMWYVGSTTQSSLTQI